MSNRVRLLLSCLPVVIVLGTITVFFLRVEPYRIVGDNLLVAGGEARVLPARGSQDPAVRERSRWHGKLPDLDRLAPLWLLVRGRARVESVQRGDRGWKLARADFTFLDPQGRVLRDPDYTLMATGCPSLSATRQRLPLRMVCPSS
jgi:hypothetical protein